MPYQLVLLSRSNQAAMREKKIHLGDSVAGYSKSPAQLLYGQTTQLLGK